MSYDKHLQKTIAREETRNENTYYTHKTIGKSFFYEYNLMYNNLQNSYLSLVQELAFCEANNNKRSKKIKLKINKMKKQYPEMLLVL